MKKTKFTEKDFKSFQDQFMNGVALIGLTEYRYGFDRVEESCENTADTCGDLEQMAMRIRLAKAIDADVNTKEEDIKDAAEHEALEVLFYALRMAAIKGRSDDEMIRIDGLVHTLINRVQPLIFK